MSKKIVVVIGGGAAGMFCAVNAARLNPDLKVIVIEKTNQLLSKVKVSGGGRCNVTHQCGSIAEMIKNYPRGKNFLKKGFHQFFVPDIIAWFRERGVPLKVEDDGRMFPASNSSITIINCFLAEATDWGVEVLMNKNITELVYENNRWAVHFFNTGKIIADYVCIACGGFSKPENFKWLQKLNLNFVSPAPSLFTFNIPGNAITKLMGVQVENAVIKITGTTWVEKGPLLITHWGFSGPAVIRLSAWAARELAGKKYFFTITVNWVSSYNDQTLMELIQQLRFEIASQKIINRNPFALPQRLWKYLMLQSGINEDLRWADLPAKEQNKLIKNLCSQEFEVKGKTTFKEEFVTAGGISLNDIDADTMQSKQYEHLYFAGEMIDVDGITGGFNFQNAWTTGFIAAKAIAQKSKI